MQLKTTNRITLVLATVVLTILATVGVGVASDAFSDVPASNQFHDEIGELAASCISKGWDDGTFRPANDVTRQAMAAFLTRGLPRSYEGTTTGDYFPTFGGSTDVTVATLDVTTPDVGAGCSFDVHLTGWAAMFTNDTRTDACSDTLCNLWLELRADGSTIGETFLRISGDQDGGNLTVSDVYEQAAGTTVTYTLVASNNNVAADAAYVNDSRSITAIVTPNFD